MMRSSGSYIARLFCLVVVLFVATAFSCAKVDLIALGSELYPEPSTLDTLTVFVRPGDDPKLEPVDLDGKVTVTPYAELVYGHQSAAVYGDYAIFVKVGRQSMRLFDMARKTKVATISLKKEDSNQYHCNQSSFGAEKYEPGDYFPLLYISQRSRSEGRCFMEVFRVIPLINADSTAILTFRVELVQEIFFPPMSQENSLGNVNCVMDPDGRWMYTYSRNNNADDRNYLQCKISRFAVPDVHQREVVLEDSDIESSFLIDAKATNMQGGCIVDGRLYIAQGYPAKKYVYLNVVDLREERLVKRYDLLASGADWEPEGCFYYDGSVMLAHTGAICRIEEEE